MLTESATVDQITICENGIVLVRTATRIQRGDTEIAKSYHRASLTPGENVTHPDPRVRAVCAAVWTPPVVAAYRQQIEAEHARWAAPAGRPEGGPP